MGRLNRRTRGWLLTARIYSVPEKYSLDPHSLEYLYFVQQRKRLSLAASVGRVRPVNALKLPFIVPIVLLKTVDLWITNQLIQSLINEHTLLQRIEPTQKSLADEQRRDPQT